MTRLKLGVRARRELLLLAMAVMEISWLALLLHALIFFSGTRALPETPFWVPLPYLALMLLGYGTYRGVERLGLPEKRERWIMAGFLLLVVLVMLRTTIYAGYAPLDFGWIIAPFAAFASVTALLPGEVAEILLVLVLLGRGIALAGADVSSRAVGLRFRVSILLLMVTLAAADPRWPVTSVVFMFFFFGLCAIAVARTAEAGEESRSTGRFGLNWLGAIMASAALVLLLGAGISALVSPENAAFVFGLLEPLVIVVGFVLYILFAILSLLVQAVWPVLYPLLAAITEAWRRMAEMLRQTLPNQDPSTELRPLDPNTLAIIGGTKGLITALTILVIVLVILWTMNLIMGRRQENEEEHETVFSGSLLGGALRAVLRAGQGRLSGLIGQARTLRLAGLFSAFTIRRIYAQMSALAARRGHPRAPAETPLEYRGALTRAFPGGGEHIERITRAYLGVRYGELPETTQDLEAVRSAWEALKAIEVPATQG